MIKKLYLLFLTLAIITHVFGATEPTEKTDQVVVTKSRHRLGGSLQGGLPLGLLASTKTYSYIRQPQSRLYQCDLGDLALHCAPLFEWGFFYGYALAPQSNIQLDLLLKSNRIDFDTSKYRFGYSYRALSLFPHYRYGEKLFFSIGIKLTYLLSAVYHGHKSMADYSDKLTEQVDLLRQPAVKRFFWSLVPGLGYETSFGLWIKGELALWHSLYTHFFRDAEPLTTRNYNNELLDKTLFELVNFFQAVALLAPIQLAIGYNLGKLL